METWYQVREDRGFPWPCLTPPPSRLGPQGRPTKRGRRKFLGAPPNTSALPRTGAPPTTGSADTGTLPNRGGRPLGRAAKHGRLPSRAHRQTRAPPTGVRRQTRAPPTWGVATMDASYLGPALCMRTGSTAGGGGAQVAQCRSAFHQVSVFMIGDFGTFGKVTYGGARGAKPRNPTHPIGEGRCALSCTTGRCCPHLLLDVVPPAQGMAGRPATGACRRCRSATPPFPPQKIDAKMVLIETLCVTSEILCVAMGRRCRGCGCGLIPTTHSRQNQGRSA